MGGGGGGGGEEEGMEFKKKNRKKILKCVLVEILKGAWSKIKYSDAIIITDVHVRALDRRHY